MHATHRRSLAIRASVVLLVLGTYITIALLHGGSLASGTGPTGFHGVTAEALLKGDFAVAPAPPELLALPNPYDPAQNASVRGAGWHDYALYGSSLYAPFGPAPAALLHIPAKLLGFGYLNPRLATLLCIAVGFLALCGATRIAVDRWGRRERWWVEPLLLLGLGLATPLPWLVSIGRAYEESIACGFAAVATCVWALGRATTAVRRVWPWLVLASASVGVAAGSRPHLAASGILILVAAVVVVRGRADRRWIGRLAALLAPAALAAVVLALYNLRRFGSPFEFGTRYQLAGFDMQAYPIGKRSYWGPNLGDYLVSPPRVTGSLPWIRLRLGQPASDPAIRASEPVAGMALLYPWIVVGLAACVGSVVTWWRRQRDLLLTALTIGSVAVFSLMGVSSAFNGATMRYTVDFVPWFAVVAALGLVWLACRTPMGRLLRIAFTVVWLVTLAWGLYCGVALASIDCRGTGSC